MRRRASRGSRRAVLYGASGETGRRIAKRALERGVPLVLAGRDGARLEALSAALGGPLVCAASLGDRAALARAFEGASVILSAAGPFEDTLAPVLEAALAAGAHYLDVSGEARAVERALGYAKVAREQGLMVMPAVGFDVLASDCLAVHVARRLPAAAQLALGIFGLAGFSRGSARAMARQAGASVLVRRRGELESLTPGELRRSFLLDGAHRPAVAVTWADVITAWVSTGVPCISTYFGETAELQAAIVMSRAIHAAGAGSIAARMLDPLVSELGPTIAATEPRTTLIAEARARDGALATSRLVAPGPYAFTALSAVAVLERVLSGDFEPGFETPGRVYGPDFVLSLPGVTREDLS